jgi:hypothetical protein
MHGRGEKSVQDLVEKPEGKRPLRRPRHRWNDEIIVDLRETGRGEVDSGVSGQHLLYMVMNLFRFCNHGISQLVTTFADFKFQQLYTFCMEANLPKLMMSNILSDLSLEIEHSSVPPELAARSCIGPRWLRKCFTNSISSSSFFQNFM